MKRLNFLGKTTLFFVAGSTFFLAQSNDAFAAFSGDLCFSVHYTQRETGPVDETFVGKIHIKPVDASTCVAHSLFSTPSDNPAFMTGTCKIGPTTIYMNLTETQVHTDGWVDSEIMQWRLNATSLNGTIRMISQDFNTKTHTFTPGYAAGTVTKITCP